MATASSTACRRTSSVRLIVLVAVAAGAGAAAPRAATAGAGCTQEDMQALVLHLPSTAGELAVEVAGVPKPGARVFALSGLRRDPATPPRDLARASLHRGDGDEWLRGTLRLRRVAPGAGAAGDYDFRRADGSRLRGRFDARWSSTPADCG